MRYSEGPYVARRKELESPGSRLVDNFLVIVQKQSAAHPAEDYELSQVHLLQTVLQRRSQYAEAVLYAAAKAYRRSLREILRRAGYFADPVIEIRHLCQHFVIKHKIVGVLLQRQGGQYLAGKDSKPSVMLAEFLTEQEVLKCRQKTIRNILVQGHSSLERPFP